MGLQRCSRCIANRAHLSQTVDGFDAVQKEVQRLTVKLIAC